MARAGSRPFGINDCSYFERRAISPSLVCQSDRGAPARSNCPEWGQRVIRTRASTRERRRIVACTHLWKDRPRARAGTPEPLGFLPAHCQFARLERWYCGLQSPSLKARSHRDEPACGAVRPRKPTKCQVLITASLFWSNLLRNAPNSEAMKDDDKRNHLRPLCPGI
jgi:hypothetical protein